MLNRHVILITLTVRRYHVEYSSFVQKLVEFNLIYFQLNYERIMRLKTFAVFFQMTMIHFRN